MEGTGICHRDARSVSSPDVLRCVWCRQIQQFNIQVGEELNVFFDIDAREWQGRWFNSIRAWKVERVGAAQQMPPMDAPFPPMNAAPAAPVDFAASDEKDDLPF